MSATKYIAVFTLRNYAECENNNDLHQSGRMVHNPITSQEVGFDSSLEFAAKSRNCTVSGFFIGTSYGGAGGRAQALPVFAPRVPRSVNPSALPPDLTVGRQSFNGTLEAIMANTLASSGATFSATTALVPVFAGTLQGQSVQLCDARTLHTFMGVLRDFTTWVKGRIRKFGFVEGVDYLLTKSGEKVLPQSGENLGGRPSAEYHLTLDMAKELAMVENNPKGREARRYFIECEKQVLAALSSGYVLPTTITPAQAQHLRELVQLVVESGKQGHGESWNRLHRKMQVNSYLMLRPDQFDAACQYLGGKFDDTSIATLIQKHLPHAVAALPPKNAPQALPVNTSEMRLSELISAGNGIYIETDELHRIAAVCMDRLAGRANFHQARAMQLRMDSAS